MARRRRPIQAPPAFQHSLSLFLGAQEPPCLEAADTNDDSRLDISDRVYTLSFLFLDGPALPSPGPSPSPCGADPAASPGFLGCASYPGCK